MTLQITDHTVAAWQAFANAAQFVPDPMILRTGEVFANGARGAQALGKADTEVETAIRDNIAGLIEFFDLVVIYDRVPLIDYDHTFDKDSGLVQLATLLGPKALPVNIGHQAYDKVKSGALAALAGIDPGRIGQFGHQLAELDSLRYDWRPKLDDGAPEGWLAQAARLDEPTRRAAQFLLGGLIFSGFAQASLTEHIIQPKRSRFLLALTAAPPTAGGVTRADEAAVFAAAEAALQGTPAKSRRLDALPPVLPYLLARAPAGVTASDLLQRALDFANTKDGDNFRKAAALIRGDGVGAARTEDLANVAKAEALALLQPYSALADNEGGLKVEITVPFNVLNLSASRTVTAPAWLKLWWNEHTPFGGLRKTFRRMWMTAESYRALEQGLFAAGAKP